MQRGGDFTMALSVLNQEAFVGNQNTFFFFFWYSHLPEESKEYPLLENQNKILENYENPPNGIINGS